MSAVERLTELTDEQLLNRIGPPGSDARNAAMALALKSLYEGAQNAREAAEHSGCFIRHDRPAG